MDVRDCVGPSSSVAGVELTPSTYQSIGTLNKLGSTIVRVADEIELAQDYELEPSRGANFFYGAGGFFSSSSDAPVEIEFADGSTITGLVFRDIKIQGDRLRFVRCRFEGTLNFDRLRLSSFNDSEFVDATITSSSRTANLQVFGGSMTRVDFAGALLATIEGTQVEHSTVFVDHVRDVRSKKSVFQVREQLAHSRIRDSHIELTVGDDVFVHHNWFDDLLTGYDQVITVTANSHVGDIHIDSNTFNLGSSDPRAILISGLSTATHAAQIVTITRNTVYRTRAIEADPNSGPLLVRDNILLRNATLGVVNEPATDRIVEGTVSFTSPP